MYVCVRVPPQQVGGMDGIEMERGTLLPLDSPKQQTLAHDISEVIDVPSEFAAFGIPLYPYHEIPTFLKGNPYITAGYRAHLDPQLCVKSSLACTNETVNIWSHLLGLLYFSSLFLHDNFSFLPDNGGDFGDHLTFSVLDFCFIVCMFCSAGYHTFSCQSERASRRWLSLDLAGVSVGLCGCYFPGAYYAFFCWNIWRIFYFVAISLLAVVSIFAQVHPNFLSNHWYMRRLALYSALIFAGVVPVAHWVLLSGGPQQPIVQLFMPKMVVMYLLALLGGSFYVSKFPEKYFPGKVNFVGSSHQWWHVMVLISFYWSHHLAETIFLHWRTHTCSKLELRPWNTVW